MLLKVKCTLLYKAVVCSLFFMSCDSNQRQATQVSNLSLESTNCEGMIEVPGGSFLMGADNDQAEPDEYPKHKVHISDFYLDEHEVTNAQFTDFVESTGYITMAERPVIWEEIKKELPEGTPKPADSILQPGALVFHKTSGPVSLDDFNQWWSWTTGASWKSPRGKGSGIAGIPDHPVVQVAWEDAMAFCKWKNKRLPTEAEWEWASRGGRENQVYSWGSNELDEENPKANFWQGTFPWMDKMVDGYSGTAPVKSFPPNDFGLYDMPGNVWEWCSDYYDHNYYRRMANSGELQDPIGPQQTFDPAEPYATKRVLRGGSFLCNEKYCSGYRNSRRMRNSEDTGMEHIGFRCACDK